MSRSVSKGACYILLTGNSRPKSLIFGHADDQNTLCNLNFPFQVIFSTFYRNEGKLPTEQRIGDNLIHAFAVAEPGECF